MKLYEYKGNYSGIGNSEIMLYADSSYEESEETPPARLTVPGALYQYLNGLSYSDAEEKYYTKIFRYDRNLILMEIVIPAATPAERPAKIITQERLMSEKCMIFGERAFLEEPEDKLESMSTGEYCRYKRTKEEFADRFYTV